jgi:hypothetical protein
MARNTFTDPATGDHYDWQVNHDTEEAVSKARAITRTATTNNVGSVRQQGADGPLVLKFSGTILHRSQLREMWRWYELCRMQTIYFTDFDGQSYEVQISEFSPLRKRTLRNPRDPSLNHYWTYTITMDVFRPIDGDLADMGVTP